MSLMRCNCDLWRQYSTRNRSSQVWREQKICQWYEVYQSQKQGRCDRGHVSGSMKSTFPFCRNSALLRTSCDDIVLVQYPGSSVVVVWNSCLQLRRTHWTSCLKLCKTFRTIFCRCLAIRGLELIQEKLSYRRDSAPRVPHKPYIANN